MEKPIEWTTATEKELREASAPCPKTFDELRTFMEIMANRQHDYGTCVYAVSLSAVAAYNLMAHLQGITGFQASCADLDILSRNRNLKHGFRIIDYDKLLYPQYCTIEHFPSLEQLLGEHKVMLAQESRRLIANARLGYVAQGVLEHWEWLASRCPEDAGPTADR